MARRNDQSSVFERLLFSQPVKGGKDAATRTRMQGMIVADYPNVSVIDLREVLDSIKTIVDNVTLGVHYMWDWLEDVLKPGK